MAICNGSVHHIELHVERVYVPRGNCKCVCTYLYIHALYFPISKGSHTGSKGEVQTKHTYQTYNILLMMRILIELPMECVLR